MTFEAPQTNGQTESAPEDLTNSVRRLREVLDANKESEIKDQLCARRAEAFELMRESNDPRQQLQQLIDDSFFVPTEDEENRWQTDMPNAHETAQEFLNTVKEGVERDANLAE